MTKSPFDKLQDAYGNGLQCTLTHADVELLLDTLGGAFGVAQAEYETWHDRLAEYKKRNLEREATKTD